MHAQDSAQLTAEPVGGLVFEQLPSGEWTWLRPEPHPVRVVHDAGAPLPPTDRVALTELGRRALAMAALFDEWPTVAQARGLAADPLTQARQACARFAADEGIEVADVWAARAGIPPALEREVKASRCPACHQPQTNPSCATREHWGV